MQMEKMQDDNNNLKLLNNEIDLKLQQITFNNEMYAKSDKTHQNEQIKLKNNIEDLNKDIVMQRKFNDDLQNELDAVN